MWRTHTKKQSAETIGQPTQHHVHYIKVETITWHKIRKTQIDLRSGSSVATNIRCRSVSQRPVLLVALLRAGGAAKVIVGHSTVLNRSSRRVSTSLGIAAAGAVEQVPAVEQRPAVDGSSRLVAKIFKRLGGNKSSFACSLRELTPNGIMKLPSYIRLVELLMLGNVFPSEFKGQIV